MLLRGKALQIRGTQLTFCFAAPRFEPARWPAMLRDSGDMGRHRQDHVKRHLVSNANPDIQALAWKMVAQHVRPLHQANGRLQGLRPAYPLQVQGTVQAVQVEVVDGRPCTWWSLGLAMRLNDSTLVCTDTNVKVRTQARSKGVLSAWYLLDHRRCSAGGTLAMAPADLVRHMPNG